MTADPEQIQSCAYCGLPVPGLRLRWRGTVAGASVPPAHVYCCSGCRFAASILTSEATDSETRRTLLKLGLAIFFAMNVMVFSMVLWSCDMYREELRTAGPLAHSLYQVFRFLALLFCAPVLFLLGEPLAISAWQAIRGGVITTDILLILGVAAAFLYSLGSVVAGDGQIYFEVAAVILVFVTLGRWLEAQGKLRSGEALDALAKLLPEKVHLLRDNKIVDVSRSSAVVGDELCVFPGERFAVDGVIAAGEADIDEQVVTGESRSVGKRPGDSVYSGTLNLDGDLRIAVTAAAGSETVSRMLDLVRKSRRARGRYQRIADRATAWFVPAVAIVALIAAWWHGRHEGIDSGILAGLAVVLIACPCALGLATPMAAWIGIGRAARGQVLFRSGQALEQTARLRAMLFDKTGTLTSGNADVAALATEPATDVRLILGRATQLASASNHSLASSICRYASGLAIANAVDGFRTATLDELRTIPGKGLQAQFVLGSEGNVGRELVWLGSLPWLREEGLAVSDPLWNAVETAGGREAPLSGVAWGGRVHGIFVFHEQVRPETVQALNQCRALGIHVAVVTGDRRPRAERLAASLGVPVLAEQLPEHKVAAIEESRRKYGSVAMVGDGINDAPALGASDVGIAMGCGADLSREAAAVCLLSDDLTRLPWSVALARQTVRIIRQNLFWAFSYNIVGIGLAACGRLSPVFAALAMVASSAFVISNSLRLGRFPDTAHESIAADQQGHGGAMADGNMPAGSPGYTAEHDVSLSQKPSPAVELQTTTI